jgi:integrase
MAGQLIKKSEKRWLVRIFLGCDSRTGKRKFHNKMIRGTKKDAEVYRTALLRDKDLGAYVEQTKITFNEYLDQWIETSARARLRERTLDDYVDKINRYIRPALGGMKLSNISQFNIQALYTELQKKGLTATVRYVHVIIRSSLKHAISQRMLLNNPADAVKPPRIERKEMKALSKEEAARFLKSAAEDRHGTLFAFAIATGMRPEEYLALQWKDIDLIKGTATVQRTLVWRKGGGWYFGEPKTSRSRRTIPVPSSLLRMLIEHRRNQMETRLRAGATYQNNNLVFATCEGNPLHLRNLTLRHFKLILKRAGLLEIRLYDLRHTCATLLLSANEHPKVVSERLGHASVTLTLDTYSHVLPSMQQAATEKLENILFG